MIGSSISVNDFGSNTAVFASQRLQPAPYRAHFAAHKPDQHAGDDSKHHNGAAFGQSVDLPALQHRSEDERDRHPQQRQRHVQRQILLFAVATVGGNRRAAARPARHAVDFEAVVRAVVELGVADVDDRAVLGVRKGKRRNEDVHDLHFGGDAVAHAGLKRDFARHAVERDVQNAFVEQSSLLFGSAPHAAPLNSRKRGVGLRFEYSVQRVGDGHHRIIDKNRVFGVQIVASHDLLSAQLLRLRLHLRVLRQIVLRLTL